MRMCVNAHVYVRVCMNHSILMYTYCNFDGVRLLIHTHICISVCVKVCIYIHAVHDTYMNNMYTHVYTHTYICICIYLHVCKYVFWFTQILFHTERAVGEQFDASNTTLNELRVISKVQISSCTENRYIMVHWKNVWRKGMFTYKHIYLLMPLPHLLLILLLYMHTYLPLMHIIARVERSSMEKEW